MNLDASTLERLMAYADGELEGAERAEIEALVQSNEDAARVLGELGTLGDVVRVVEDARSSRLAAADGIADAVMAKVQAEQAVAPAPARTSTRPASTSTRPAPVVDLAARRRRNYGLVAALVAAAAAVVFIARPHDDEGPAPTAVAPTNPAPVASPAPLPSVTPPPTAVASAEPAPAPSEAPSNVSVIVVPSEGNTAPSVVIWLGDDTAGGPVK